MPWTTKNPPSVAKNWNKREKELCVKAANAVLAKGGSDSDAIFACIHAAGKSKKDETISPADLLTGKLTLAKMAKLRNPKKKLKKAPLPPSPRGSARFYANKLRTMINTLESLTKELFMPNLAGIVKQATVTDSRLDDYVDDLYRSLDRLKARFYGLYTQKEINRMAMQVAEDINNKNSKYYARLAETVAGVQPTLKETWLLPEVKLFVERNVSLIKTIPEDYFKEIEHIVTTGVQQGKMTVDISKEISAKYFGRDNKSWYKAKRIARDQSSKFNSSLHRKRQQALGIKKYRWWTAADERVRSSHKANHNKIFSWDNPPSTGHPGEAIQCRCIARPIIEL